MNLVDCTLECHGPEVLEIQNEIIRNSTAIYDYAPRPVSILPEWFGTKVTSNCPVIGAESDSGELLGYATYGTFRARPAYKYTVEHSVHLRADARGKGLGGVLLTKLVEAAEARGVHVMVGGIDASNAASIALHVKHGFVHTGTIRAAGFKFGRWLDLAFYQRVLAGPTSPVDG